MIGNPGTRRRLGASVALNSTNNLEPIFHEVPTRATFSEVVSLDKPTTYFEKGGPLPQAQHTIGRALGI